MKQSKPQYLQATDKLGRGLRVTFIWKLDRYAHSVEIVQGERLIPLLATDNSEDGSHWPLSPPMQQLTIEERADDRYIALGVGMAGRSHWSLSIEPLAGEAGFLFDIACRASSKRDFVGARYRSQVPAEIAPEGQSARFQIGTSCVLVSAVALAEQPPTFLEETADGISIEPRVKTTFTAETFRWQYEVRLVGS